MIAIGASLTYYTVDGGSLFPKAYVAQIDERPLGLRDGARAGDLFLKARCQGWRRSRHRGAASGAASSNAGYRSQADRGADQGRRPIDPAEFPIAPGTFDPRAVIEQLDRVIPKDWDLVSGSGHQGYFQTHMRGRKPENFHVMREFGAIGNSISIAMGVAAARGNGKVALIEGDGSLIMHIQELETMRRHGIKLLICVLNDGAYGAEIHKLRQDGLDDSGAIFGRTDFGVDLERLRAARHQRHRPRPALGAAARLRGAGRRRDLEHPDLRPGDLADHAQEQDQGPRRDLTLLRRHSGSRESGCPESIIPAAEYDSGLASSLTPRNDETIGFNTCS